MTTLNENNAICKSSASLLNDVDKLVLTPIIKIDDNTFKRFTNLTEIDLTGNSIENIGLQTFEHCGKLKKLKLKNCRIKTINGGSFSHLTNLEELDLSDNELTLDRNTFTGLAKLKILNLENCQIRELPSKIFTNLEQLTILILTDNLISELNYGQFIGLNSLKELYLNKCKISKLIANFAITFKRLPSNIHLSNLEILDLSGNEIFFHGNDVFFGLNKLKRLNLSNNKITTLYVSALYNTLPAIELIQVGENPIDHIELESHHDKLESSYFDGIVDEDISRKKDVNFDFTGCTLTKHLLETEQVLNFHIINLFYGNVRKNKKKKTENVHMIMHSRPVALSEDNLQYSVATAPLQEKPSNSNRFSRRSTAYTIKMTSDASDTSDVLKGGHYEKYLKYVQKNDEILKILGDSNL